LRGGLDRANQIEMAGENRSFGAGDFFEALASARSLGDRIEV